MIVRSAGNNTQNMLNTMTTQQNKLYEIYNQINSNQKFDNVSDNPIDAADILKVNKQLTELEAYEKNIEDATTQINAQDSTLTTIIDKMQRINELAIQAANSPSGSEGFKACALEIKELTNTIASLANTQYDGKYIFAGTNVTTQPFTVDEATGSIVYNGTPNDHYAGYERTLDITDDMKIELNSAGDTIFGNYDASVDPATGEGLFKVLGDLNKIMEGDMDNLAVSEQLKGIQDSIKHISEIQSIHSSTVARLNSASETLSDTKLTLQSRKAELSEVDMTTAISELVRQNYALQASMQAYSMISNQSLMDYI